MTSPLSAPEPADRRSPNYPYAELRDAISDGSIGPGEHLVEQTLSSWFGVSRTPVREALTRLEHDGLIQRKGRGFAVRERSPEEILDIYEVRIVLESTACGEAALRRTPIDKVRLERLQAQCEQARPDDENELARLNRDFHHGVWLASHNEALVDLLGRLNLHLMRYPATTLSFPGRWEKSLEEHRAIVKAISRGDAKAAKSLAKDHFTEARNIRLKLWEQDTI